MCRRLRQDVAGFWSFVISAANALGIAPIKFASMLVRRWPSGAPLMRSPDEENLDLAGDEWANNHFIYDDPSRPSPLRPIEGYAGDNFPQAAADILGQVCPHFAHIRKMNPRDLATDLGKPADSLTRMVLRRGIPFGPPLVGKRLTGNQLTGLRTSAKLQDKSERGLMFVCYGASIEDQFEFLTRRWANSPVHPNYVGHDPLIGATEQQGHRTRYIDVPTSKGVRRLKLKQEWVTPTGGGYFFAPPISALTDVLGA